MGERPGPPEDVGLEQRGRERAGHLGCHREERLGQQPREEEPAEEARNGDPVGNHSVAEVDPGGGRQQPKEERVGQPAAGRRGKGHLEREPGGIAGKLPEATHLPPPQADDDGERGQPDRGRAIDRLGRRCWGGRPRRPFLEPPRARRQPAPRDRRLRHAKSATDQGGDKTASEQAGVGEGHQSGSSGGQRLALGVSSPRRIAATILSGESLDVSITTPAHSR